MTAFADNLAFSFQVTGPIFAVLFLGVLLKRWQFIDDAFVETGTRLVFNITLPALLFVSISETGLEAATNLRLLGAGLAGTLAVFGLLEWGFRRAGVAVSNRGVMVQGGFRSNMGIVGLAYCINAYGDQGLVAASLYLALVTLAFNVLSVITLSHASHQRPSLVSTLQGILRNPLIIGILLALPLAILEIRLPEVVARTGHYFAQMTLPLALLCTGASLNFRALRRELGPALGATAAKLLLTPLVLTGLGLALGLRGLDLGILFLMASAPTAAASYVMVRSLGGNAALAANIVALTTLGSLFTTSLGITLLRAGGWI